jgi:hypothetical protein
LLSIGNGHAPGTAIGVAAGPGAALPCAAARRRGFTARTRLPAAFFFALVAPRFPFFFPDRFFAFAICCSFQWLAMPAA